MPAHLLCGQGSHGPSPSLLPRVRTPGNVSAPQHRLNFGWNSTCAYKTQASKNTTSAQATFYFGRKAGTHCQERPRRWNAALKNP